MARLRTRIACLLLAAALSALYPLPASAQGASSITRALAGPTSALASSGDALGRDTPAGTVFGFLQAAQLGNYKAAAQYLKLSPSRRLSQGDELAMQLSAVMDRAFIGSLKNISNLPDGMLQPGVPAGQQRLGSLSAGDVDAEVVLVHVSDSASGKIWLFSPATLDKVPDVYDQLQARRIETNLPRPLVVYLFLGMPIWQWLALVLSVPIAAGAAWVLLLLFVAPVRWWRERAGRQLEYRPWKTIWGPFWFLVGVGIHGIFVAYLRLPLLHRHYYFLASRVAFTIAITWITLRAVSLSMRRARDRAIAYGRTGTGSLVLLGQRIIKAAIFIAAGLAILSTLGFNMTTALAGIGIGGIAVAFAAQKTLENLFGGISLLGDEVLSVGDTCRIGDRVGTVEDISLRSTRLRTTERSELSIPNGALATVNLENLSRRDKILFTTRLGLRYETSSDQLRFVLAEIRRLLYEHPRVESESARIRFAEFSDGSLGLELFSYILTTDQAEFTAVREDLLLRIMEIVEKSGTGFAFPSRTVYLGRDSGLDKSKTGAAVEAVQQWRDASELPFPDFKPEDVSSFRDAITYPGPDSALGKKR